MGSREPYEEWGKQENITQDGIHRPSITRSSWWHEEGEERMPNGSSSGNGFRESKEVILFEKEKRSPVGNTNPDSDRVRRGIGELHSHPLAWDEGIKKILTIFFLSGNRLHGTKVRPDRSSREYKDALMQFQLLLFWCRTRFTSVRHKTLPRALSPNRPTKN